MMSETLRRQIRDGEDVSTEFQRTAGDFDRIARTVCALLNSEGGAIFCGLDDKGALLGLGAGADGLRATLELRLQELIRPKALFTLNVEQEGDATILVVDVPIGRDRPYTYDGAIYVRHGARTRTATHEVMTAMVQARAIESLRWERRPSANLQEEDLDGDRIQDMVERARSNERFRFRKPDSNLHVLQELALFGPAGFTQAADVLFGRTPAQRHPQCRARVLWFENDKDGDYYDNRWFAGPLVKVFDDLVDAVLSRQRIASTFPPEEMQRRDHPQYARPAVREAVVNAIAHREYAGFSGGVVVSIYPNRLEVWNSGRLPDGLKTGDLRKKHPSIPLNPDISHGLYLHGLMDQAGRGTLKIVTLSRAMGALAPRWEDRPTGVTLTLYPGVASALGRLEVNLRQEALLLAFGFGETITLGAYLDRFAPGVTDRTARRDLANLVELGLFEQQGQGGGTLYRRTTTQWP